MEGKTPESIPYFSHEGICARMERIIKRLWIALVVAILIAFATNAIWLYTFTRYDFESYDYSQDGRGINIIGDGNGVDYGTTAESPDGNP